MVCSNDPTIRVDPASEQSGASVGPSKDEQTAQLRKIAELQPGDGGCALTNGSAILLEIIEGVIATPLPDLSRLADKETFIGLLAKCYRAVCPPVPDDCPSPEQIFSDDTLRTYKLKHGCEFVGYGCEAAHEVDPKQFGFCDRITPQLPCMTTDAQRAYIVNRLLLTAVKRMIVASICAPDGPIQNSLTREHRHQMHRVGDAIQKTFQKLAAADERLKAMCFQPPDPNRYERVRFLVSDLPLEELMPLTAAQTEAMYAYVDSFDDADSTN